MTRDARVVAAAVLVAVAAALPLLLTGALAVQITASLSAGFPVVAVSVSASLMVGGVCALSAGRLVDRIGWQRGAQLAAVVTSAALGLATWMHARPVGFVLAIAIGGVGISLSQPAANLALLDRKRGAHSGALFGVRQSASPVAGLLGGLAVPVIALTVGWRWAFASGLLFPLLAVVTIPRGGRETGRRPLPLPPPDGAAQQEAAAQDHAPALHRRAGPGHPLLLLSLGGGLASMGIGAMNAYMAPTAVHAGYQEGAAGVLIAAASLAGIVVRISGGIMLDRGGRGSREAFWAVILLLLAGVTGFGLLAIGALPLVAPAALLMFAGGWSWVGLFHYAVVTTHLEAPGRATGMCETGLQSGAVVGPVVFALLASRGGFSAGWVVMLLTSTAGALLIAFAARDVRHTRGGGQDQGEAVFDAPL